MRWFVASTGCDWVNARTRFRGRRSVRAVDLLILSFRFFWLLFFFSLSLYAGGWSIFLGLAMTGRLCLAGEVKSGPHTSRKSLLSIVMEVEQPIFQPGAGP